MPNYIVKIEPEHMPRLIECGELTLEYMQTMVEGLIEVTVPNRDLQAKYPDLRMIVNEEGWLFDLPFNPAATMLHDVLRGQILGTAIFVIAEGEDLRPLTEAEATDFREAVEQLYDIEFEEGEEE